MGWLDRLRGRGDPQTDPAAEATAAMQQGLDAAAAGNYELALSLWGPLAQAGVARAQNAVGTCFSEGLGVERDPAMALRWLTLAAAGGDRIGQRNLATLYFRGEGVAADSGRAMELYRQAAEQGDATAQDMLSWMLLEQAESAGEHGLPIDTKDVVLWAQRAALQGNTPSMTRLGMMYHNATGVERDVVLAAQWWQQAADMGDADAQAMLGAAYHLGAGVAVDNVTALAWLLRARRGGSDKVTPYLLPIRQSLDAAGQDEARRRADLPLDMAEPAR